MAINQWLFPLATYDLWYICAWMIVQGYRFVLLIDLAHNYLVLMVVMMLQLWVSFLQRLELSNSQFLSHMPISICFICLWLFFHHLFWWCTLCVFVYESVTLWLICILSPYFSLPVKHFSCGLFPFVTTYFPFCCQITQCTNDGVNRIVLNGCDARIFCLGVRIVKRRTVQQVVSSFEWPTLVKLLCLLVISLLFIWVSVLGVGEEG